MPACFSIHQSVHRRTQICLVVGGLLVALVGLPCAAVAQSQSTVSASASGSPDYAIRQTVERMDLIVKSSRVLSLGDRIPRFLVHNEEVLGVSPVSENQVQIFGKNPGTTQVNLWDTNDKLYTIDVTVIADARELEGILSSQLPLASLRVMPIGESAILSGYVTSVDDVDRAVAIAEQFYTVIINNIEVVGVQQVLLHTKIMEVSRTKFRQLGIDLAIFDSQFRLMSGPSGIIDTSQGLTNVVATNSDAVNLRFNANGDVESLIKALSKNNLIKLLAEPTVVATHGRPARFTVGGRIPYIIPGQNGQTQVNYEDYGTSIDFLPFVIGPGRIRLEVRPEVSEPDEARGIRIQNTTVTAFTTRYVETAVEMQAGQTFALAGLLQSRTESEISRTPFLGAVPYLGALFRNVREKRNEIELLIMVTPELVEAMDPYEVPRGGPGLNSDSPDDCELYAHGHIEVPNLKADDCQNAGVNCGPEGMISSPGTMVSPAPGPMMHGPVYDESSSSGPAIHDPMMYHQSRQAPASRPSPTPAATDSGRRVASRPRSSVESGTLLTPPGIVPGSEPMIVGEGVTLSSPGGR